MVCPGTVFVKKIFAWSKNWLHSLVRLQFRWWITSPLASALITSIQPPYNSLFYIVRSRDRSRDRERERETLGLQSRIIFCSLFSDCLSPEILQRSCFDILYHFLQIFYSTYHCCMYPESITCEYFKCWTQQLQLLTLGNTSTLAFELVFDLYLLT